jgi:hypothetical protein
MSGAWVRRVAEVYAPEDGAIELAHDHRGMEAER